jgi:hypothetical protein
MTRLLAGRRATCDRLAGRVKPVRRPGGNPGLTRRRIVGIPLSLCLIMKQDGFESEAG